ncbi:MAG: DUF92 domain-containing protein [candidate division Zixibacteria bacterium]
MEFNDIISRLDIAQIVSGIILSIVIAAVSTRFGALSRSGGLGMLIVGTIVFGLGGIVFAIPLIFFFVSSSLLSKISSPAKRVAMLLFDKTGPRDIWQVIANGGVGTICVIIYFISGEFFWYLPYCASLCAAAADTWATERGTMSSKIPISIVTLKKTESGRSGAVTLMGMISAAAGSALVMASGYLAFKAVGGYDTIPLMMWIAVFNAGFAGSILDSILGGSVQAMFRCPLCNRITERREHCGDTTMPISGFLFVNNDVVNFVSVLFAAGATALIILI